MRVAPLRDIIWMNKIVLLIQIIFEFKRFDGDFKIFEFKRFGEDLISESLVNQK
jgi:hypothetical protein